MNSTGRTDMSTLDFGLIARMLERPMVYTDAARMEQSMLAHAADAADAAGVHTSCRPAPDAAPVDWMVPVAWWNGLRPTCHDESSIPSFSWDGENSWHDIPLYAGMNPANLAAPTREAAPIAQGEQGDALRQQVHEAIAGTPELWDQTCHINDAQFNAMTERVLTLVLTRQPASPAEPVATSVLHRLRDAITDEDESAFGVGTCGGIDFPLRAYSIRANLLCIIDSALTAAKAAQPESVMYRSPKDVMQSEVDVRFDGTDTTGWERIDPAESAAPGAVEEAIAHLHPIVSFAMSRGVQAPYDCLAVITAALTAALAQPKPDNWQQAGIGIEQRADGAVRVIVTLESQP